MVPASRCCCQTGVSLIGYGIAVVRFLLYVHELHLLSRYFSTDPGVATAFTSRAKCPIDHGRKMLVFIVAKPLPPAVVEKPVPPHIPSNFSQSYIVPLDYIVVPTTEHQLPLGVLSFGTVKSKVLARNAKRNKLHQMQQELQRKERQAKVARLKAKVIQKIINYELDVAAEIYQKSSNYLDLAAKKEISTFAHTKYDEDFVCFYFPGLPDPMTAEEEDQMVSIEALDTEVQDNKMDVRAARWDYASIMYSYTPRVARSAKAAPPTVGPITSRSPP